MILSTGAQRPFLTSASWFWSVFIFCFFFFHSSAGWFLRTQAMSRRARSNLFTWFRALFFLIQPLCWAAGPNCYFLDHDYAPANEPCNPSAEESSCCGPGWACLANGLCRSTRESEAKYGEGVYGPPSCTDSQWNSIECFNPCRGVINY